MRRWGPDRAARMQLQMALRRGDRVYIRGHLEGVALGSRLARIVRGGFSIAGQRYVYAQLDQAVTKVENGVELQVRILPIAEDALELVTPLALNVAVKDAAAADPSAHPAPAHVIE